MTDNKANEMDCKVCHCGWIIRQKQSRRLFDGLKLKLWRTTTTAIQNPTMKTPYVTEELINQIELNHIKIQ